MTSRQTKASRGRVVNMFKPKQLHVVSLDLQKSPYNLQSSNVDKDIISREII
jgi:hypothetical protein